jgi:hypothetical protein
VTLRRKCNGAKHTTEAMASAILRDFAWVGERRMRVEVRPEGLVDCIRVRMPV